MTYAQWRNLAVLEKQAIEHSFLAAPQALLRPA